MTAKAETTFTNSVHKYLKGELYFEKMHNPFRGGTWDFWYSGPQDLWIEYKFIEIPKRPDTIIVPDLSPLQQHWGLQRANEGRNLAVIIGSKEGGIALPGTSWLEQRSAAQFREQLLTRKELSDWIRRRTGG